MNGTAANFKGPDFQGRGAISRAGALFTLMVAMLFAAQLHAQNTLQDISYQPLPGGKVQVTLKLAAPAVEPRIFTTETPPRIAIDIADTHSAVPQRHIDVNNGATSAINAVEAAGRTRVVIDLFRPATYETRSEGNNLVVTVGGGVTATAASASVVAMDQTKTVGAATVEISNIDFHRGKNGEGRIIVSFSREGASADLKRNGDHIALDIYNAKLPTQLAQRLDVLDFATPVQFVETRTKGSGAHMDITAKAPFEQLAYQSGNQYVVEIAPAKVKEKKDPNAPPVYSGNRVTFNMQDIPARTVLQLIADMSELNIVVADSVTGNVTLRLVNVPWDQALDLVLQAKGLDKRLNGNVMWVAPQKEISDRELAIADAKQKLSEVVETVTELIPINYGKAKDFADLLTQRAKQSNTAGATGGTNLANTGFLSNRGRATYDERTNTLLIADTPDKVRIIRELVARLDRPVQQVLIESRVVVATDNFAREIGAKFGISGGFQSGSNTVATSGTLGAADQMSNIALNNRLNGRTAGSGLLSSPGGIGGGIRVPGLGNSLNVSLPATNTTAGSIGLSILGADYLLDLELSAGQTEGRSELISSPRVITANQQEADIKQGTEIGYVTFANSGGGAGAGNATVAFKDAVLELKVTPTITADGRVFLNLDVKKDAIAGFTAQPGGGSIPNIDKREITTAVLLDNGQTVVLGGVYEFDKSENVTKVPFLGDLPGIGAFFRDTAKSNQKAEMLIFVTPKILDENLK
jgi:type IV pilus assembly protein PilQ